MVGQWEVGFVQGDEVVGNDLVVLMEELIEGMLVVGFGFVLDDWVGCDVDWFVVVICLFVVVFYFQLLQVGWQ